MSIHIFSSLQYDLGGVEHTFHSPFRCFDVKSHEHAPCTNIHCTCILAPAVGSMPASFPARPRTTGGSVAFLCLFFLSPSLSTRAANHHPGHARPRALDAAGDAGGLACRGGGALLRGPQQQADGVEDSSYLASVEVKQQKQTAVVCTWEG